MKENIANFLLPRTAGCHSNGLGSFIMEIIAYKGRPFSVFVDGFVSHFALLQLYSNHPVIFEISRLNRMMAAILNLLMCSDQEDGY